MNNSQGWGLPLSISFSAPHSTPVIPVLGARGRKIRRLSLSWAMYVACLRPAGVHETLPKEKNVTIKKLKEKNDKG